MSTLSPTVRLSPHTTPHIHRLTGPRLDQDAEDKVSSYVDSKSNNRKIEEQLVAFTKSSSSAATELAAKEEPRVF